MRRLDVAFAGHEEKPWHVGILVEERGRIYFEYSSEWLKRKLELSPIRLPLRPGLREHQDAQFGPLPGVFDDSLPDGWGLLLMDRWFRKQGVDPTTISPLDRLAWIGDRAMGALTYRPAIRNSEDEEAFDLHRLSKEAEEVLAGKAGEVLAQLVKAGGSPGGARPKVLVGYNPKTEDIVSGAQSLPVGFDHWIVKFVAPRDMPEYGPVEYAYSLMARAAGLNVPETRLFRTKQGDRFFGIKRFDRVGTKRIHMHTFGNLIHANFRLPTGDYADLFKTSALLTHNARDIQEVFRRMAFNVLAHNRDDHVKNFAFLMDDTTGEWSLAPAYDLAFAPGPGGEHTMSVAGEGRHPRRSDMLRAVARAGMAGRVIGEILEQVADAVDHWRDFAKQAGVTAPVMTRLQTAMDSLRL